MKTGHQKIQTVALSMIMAVVLLSISSAGNAQKTESKKTTIDTEAIEKALEQAETNNRTLQPADYTEIIHHLLDALKTLQKENERLRLENEKTRNETADRFNALEIRLSEIEKAENGEALLPAGKKVLRIPRYDRSYESINF